MSSPLGAFDRAGARASRHELLRRAWVAAESSPYRSYALLRLPIGDALRVFHVIRANGVMTVVDDQQQAAVARTLPGSEFDPDVETLRADLEDRTRS